MGPHRLDRLLRIAVAFGVGLPAAPYLLNFPHDRLYCSDVRIGDQVLTVASLLFLFVALVIRGVTFSWMTPSQRDWLVPKALGVGALWFFLPFGASYAMTLAGR